MKRRTFIQTMTAFAAAMTARAAAAQTPSPESIQNARQQLADKFAQKIELETIPEDQIEWIDGISDGTQCTMSNGQ